jgi:hypothetical protein
MTKDQNGEIQSFSYSIPNEVPRSMGLMEHEVSLHPYLCNKDNSGDSLIGKESKILVNITDHGEYKHEQKMLYCICFASEGL